jgi:hypothetical protein
MFKNISESKCWIQITDAIGITDEESRLYFLYITIFILIIFLVYYFHDNINEILKATCSGLHQINDNVRDSVNKARDSLSTTSADYTQGVKL